MFQYLIRAILLLGYLNATAQQPYEFSEVKSISHTGIKDQQRTGTCWAFSTTSFLESELIRLGKPKLDLSEMFTVRNIYRDKCENYVRRQGSARFGEGGLAHDVLSVVRRYGVVPDNIYPGRTDASKPFSHAALEKKLLTICNEAVKAAQNQTLQPNWLARVDSVLDAEFGTLPRKFSYENRPFTPYTFAEYLGLRTDDYINLTSFTHHPFYEWFVLEIPDNFANGSFYNVPLDELMGTLELALQNGYTVEWDADVSNNDFSHENGLAIVPAVDWKDKTQAQQTTTFKEWEVQRTVTPEYRQELFDRQITQDDHLMHIVGRLDEKRSGRYYVVKNSWGEQSKLKGYVYVSDAYMRLNTISFTVHKDALPAALRRKLGLAVNESTPDQNKAVNSRGLRKANPQPLRKGQ